MVRSVVGGSRHLGGKLVPRPSWRWRQWRGVTIRRELIHSDQINKFEHGGTDRLLRPHRCVRPPLLAIYRDALDVKQRRRRRGRCTIAVAKRICGATDRLDQAGLLRIMSLCLASDTFATYSNPYQRYYNEARTHLSLSKDAPVSRAVQTAGSIIATPLLGGLHHQYVRILISSRQRRTSAREKGRRAASRPARRPAPSAPTTGSAPRRKTAAVTCARRSNSRPSGRSRSRSGTRRNARSFRPTTRTSLRFSSAGSSRNTPNAATR